MDSAKRSISPASYSLFDIARAVAATAVVAGHARNMLLVDASPGMTLGGHLLYFVTGFGHQAVMIFFVISGYWISRLVARRHDTGSWAWKSYVFDRLTRLWIVLIPILLIGGLLDAFGRFGLQAPLYFGMQGTNTIVKDVADALTPTTFLGNLVFLQTLAVRTFGTNGPLWSLANEFWYYIWFAALYRLAATRKPELANMAALAVGAVIAFLFPGLLPGFACWLMGAVLFYFLERAAPPRWLTGRAAIMGALAGCAVFAAALLCCRLIPAWRGVGGDLALSAAFALGLYLVIAGGISAPNWTGGIAKFGARSSYSLYAGTSRCWR